jgi:hypothetical protein
VIDRHDVLEIVLRWDFSKRKGSFMAKTNFYNGANLPQFSHTVVDA